MVGLSVGMDLMAAPQPSRDRSGNLFVNALFAGLFGLGLVTTLLPGERHDNTAITFLLMVPWLINLALRFSSTFPPEEVPTGRDALTCPLCHGPGPLVPVRYLKMTGMIVMMSYGEHAGFMCRECSQRVFRATTGHNLVFGWWGLFSFFINIGFIVNNLMFSLRAPDPAMKPEKAHLRLLEGHREYALNLLATKDDETVIEVISKQAGVPEDAARSFVATLRAELST